VGGEVLNPAKQRSSVMSAGGVIPLWQLFLSYIIIGSIGFGPTLAAETRKRLVQQKQWIKEEEFAVGLALTQLLPGATFVNLTVYIGYRLRGFAGALTAFFALLLIPFAAMLTLSHIFFSYQSVEVVGILFKGIAVVIVGVIAHAVLEIGRFTVHDVEAGFIALAAAGLIIFLKNPFVVLLAAAAGGILAYYCSFQCQTDLLTESNHADKSKAGDSGIQVWPPVILAAIIAVVFFIAPIQPVLLKLWWVFLRMGAVLFGGGLSMIPFIQQEVVSNYGWLTLDEFAVGIALSQITPGPVLLIATFIGYKVAAVSGAIAATLGIFFSSLFLVISTAEIHQRIRNNLWVQAALKGIAASFIGMMTVMVIGLAQHALIDLFSFCVAAAVFVALRFGRLGTISVILTGTLAYFVFVSLGLAG
jgi:chromate transporter